MLWAKVRYLKCPLLSGKKHLSDFGEMKFRRKPGGYDDADEAAEEPVWQSHIHLKPAISKTHEEKLKNKLGVRQVKDLVRRESHRPRSGDFWDRLIASKGETRALGHQAGIDRQRYEIQKGTAVELLVMRNRPPPPPWEDGDLIAY